MSLRFRSWLRCFPIYVSQIGWKNCTNLVIYEFQFGYIHNKKPVGPVAWHAARRRSFGGSQSRRHGGREARRMSGSRRRVGDLGWNQTRRAAWPAGRQNDIQIDAEFNSESNGAIARSQLVLEVEILQFLYIRFLDFAKFHGHYVGMWLHGSTGMPHLIFSRESFFFKWNNWPVKKTTK